MARKLSTSFHLSDESKAIIRIVAKRLGLSQAALIEFAVRQVARNEGITEDEIKAAMAAK